MKLKSPISPISLITLISLISLALFSRFVNLNWDRGWGFHPDENNLWGASRNIKLFSQTDPKFYAYGGFPIYLYSLLPSTSPSVLGLPNKVSARAVSALCQTLIVFLLFLIGKQLIPPKSPISPNSLTSLCYFSALLAIFSAGLVQAAHFLTVESLISLFALLEIYFLLLAYKNYNRYKIYNLYLLLAAVFFGLGLATKISFAVFALPFAVLLPSPKSPISLKSLNSLFRLFLIACCSLSVFLLFNPSILTNFNPFKSTLLYESNVAIGKTPVFYTRQFINTIPGIFQFTHIFPFIIGWFFIPLFVIGLCLIIHSILYHPPSTTIFHRQSSIIILLAVLSALLSFLPFSAKWTRYVVQVLPILIIPAALTLSALWQKRKFGRLIALTSLISLIFPFLSTLKIYFSLDTRLAAADWAAVNIPKNSKIFSESYDLGIMPFNPAFQNNITLFNFYELDSSPEALAKEDELNTLIDESDYFISVSQRVYGNSLARPDKFPASANFYQQLFDGSLGYQKIYESSGASVIAPVRLWRKTVAGRGNLVSNQFCILHFAFCIPKVSYEETFGVFDHPTVMIFKKSIK